MFVPDLKPPKPTIDTVLQLHSWLLADAETPLSARTKREEKIGQAIDSKEENIALVLQWWQVIKAGDYPRTEDSHVELGVVWITRALAVAGLVIGASVMSVALTYTGDSPVNLLMLLAVVIGLPTLTLLAAFGLVWARRLKIMPASKPSRSLRVLLQRFTAIDLSAIELSYSRYDKLAYWIGHKCMQTFTLAYFLACAVTLILLVAFSDIAFGWSSTLDIQSESVYRLTQILSWPWQWLWSEATPSLALVEASRFYRGQTIAQPELLGSWWQFVLAVLLVWGVLPRLVLRLIASNKVHRHVTATLLNHSEVTALIDRLHSTDAHYTGDQDSTQIEPISDVAESVVELPKDTATITWGALSWNGADPSLQQLNAASEIAEVSAYLTTAQTHLLLRAKGWEPPLLELNDFLKALIEAHPALTVVVQPLALPGETLSPEELTAWRATIAKVASPQVYVAEPGGEGA